MRRSERGQALVEFALVLPVLLIVLVGIFDLGRVVMLSGTLDTAVREGTRYAIVHGTLGSPRTGPGGPTYTAPDRDSAVEAVVLRFATGFAAPPDVRASWPDGDAHRGSRVEVSATAPFTPVLSAAFAGGGLRITLSASSSLAIEQ